MISVFGSDIGSEELAEVRDSFHKQWLGIGPKTALFETEFAKRLALPNFLLLNSGSNSLYLAVKLLDLPKGSEIILPSFTWIACAHAVVLAGCVPVFCDVDLQTQNATVETVRHCITTKTRAIMVVHYAGKPVQMRPILELGYPVIEDAAHAVDSKIDGQACGTLGDIGIFSFDSVKNLAMAEGGGITCRNSNLIDKGRHLRYCGIGKSGFEAAKNKGRWWEHEVVDFFPKILPNDIMASIGLAQLRRLTELQARRKQIWDTYQKEFAKLAWLIRPQDPLPQEQHTYFTYLVRVKNGLRDSFAQYLYDKGIYTTLRFHPLHLYGLYGQTDRRLAASEQLNEEGLNLPLHPRLSSTDVDRIIEEVRSFSMVPA